MNGYEIGINNTWHHVGERRIETRLSQIITKVKNEKQEARGKKHARTCTKALATDEKD